MSAPECSPLPKCVSPAPRAFTGGLCRVSRPRAPHPDLLRGFPAQETPPPAPLLQKGLESTPTPPSDSWGLGHGRLPPPSLPRSSPSLLTGLPASSLSVPSHPQTAGASLSGKPGVWCFPTRTLQWLLPCFHHHSHLWPWTEELNDLGPFLPQDTLEARPARRLSLCRWDPRASPSPPASGPGCPLPLPRLPFSQVCADRRPSPPRGAAAAAPPSPGGFTR